MYVRSTTHVACVPACVCLQANSSAGVPRNCVNERPFDAASCIFPEHAYATISSPIFVVDSTLDAYQIPCIMGEWRLDPFDVKGG
jgi:hypothetical protein